MSATTSPSTLPSLSVAKKPAAYTFRNTAHLGLNTTLPAAAC